MGIMGKIRRMLGRPNITTVMDGDGTTLIHDMDNDVNVILHWDENRHLISSEVHDDRR